MNAFFGWLGGLLAVFSGGAAPGYTGYVEAKYVYVAPQAAGTIEAMAVKEGQQVKKGEPLFTQDAVQQEALSKAAEAQADAARATWQNLTTGGRAEELAAAQAAVNKANADLTLAQQTLARSQKLLASNTTTQAQVDADNGAVNSARAALNQAEAQLAVTSLPARPEQQKAAEADVAAAVANADKAKADLADRSVGAPVDARVDRIYYDPGEMAPAGTPVLSLLPAGALKVEFYVGEADRMKFSLGQSVGVACDGCATGMTGKVSYLASDPQYTSPIIYSRDERGQLVFLAEATLDNPGNILPGQPVSVSLSP